MSSYDQHAARVGSWLKSASKDLNSNQLTDLMEMAISSLWKRIEFSISLVTIQAVLDRALFNASEDHPELASLMISDEGADFSALRAHTASVPAGRLSQAYKRLLTEFLAITGSVTAEVYTEALYLELSRVNFIRPDAEKVATRKKEYGSKSKRKKKR